MPLIDVNGVSKVFRRHSGRQLLRQRIAGLFRARTDEDYFYALRDVTFSVNRGESVALIGGNGAGKSTMLSLVTGLTQPTKGTVRVSGRQAALLELGSGFHPDLTGRENVYVNAALLGMSNKEAKDRFGQIVEFSGIGDFVDEPLRTYSSGMQVRLAFSIAVHVEPAILVVDEVLAVGDSEFQEKCLKKVTELRKRQTTMLCVSHSPAMVTGFCDRAIWLHHGRVVQDGAAGAVPYAAQAQRDEAADGLRTARVEPGRLEQQRGDE
jgi:ABC-type polysaccharide/polyol phosphate transport system ATPase subunit